MCFMMDPLIGKKVCYVQFPQRFDGIDQHDRYANRNTVFFDVSMDFQAFKPVPFLFSLLVSLLDYLGESNNKSSAWHRLI